MGWRGASRSWLFFLPGSGGGSIGVPLLVSLDRLGEGKLELAAAGGVGFSDEAKEVGGEVHARLQSLANVRQIVRAGQMRVPGRAGNFLRRVLEQGDRVGCQGRFAGLLSQGNRQRDGIGDRDLLAVAEGEALPVAGDALADALLAALAAAGTVGGGEPAMRSATPLFA